jgi:hypothetical protein
MSDDQPDTIWKLNSFLWLPAKSELQNEYDSIGFDPG